MANVEFFYRILHKVVSVSWSPLMRWFLKLYPQWIQRWAQSRFENLSVPLAGLKEQATAGQINLPHIYFIQSRLEWLDVWPRGIRKERGARMIGPEAEYLYRCSKAPNGLELAREKFPKGGEQDYWTDGQGEFMRDEYYADQAKWYYRKKKDKDDEN